MIDVAKVRQRSRAVLAALLGFGALLRFVLNDVTVFSRADETTYLLGARRLAGHFIARFPDFVLDYANSPGSWVTPTPLRWGHWALISTACGLARQCDHTTLTLLSTLSGIGALLFGWLLARELLGEKPALVALALLVASPLQLHLGRRALQDEIACAATLAALWATARALAPERRSGSLAPHLLAVVICTLALAEKETAILWAPSLVVLWLLRHRARGWCRRDLLLILPPLLYFGLFCALSGSVTLFFRDAADNLGALDGASYIAQQMSGPPHRYLFDLFVLAPLPFLLGAAACGALLLDRSAEANGARELAAMLVVGILVWAPTPKDLRYLAAADALFCLLAAWMLLALSGRARWGNALAAAVVVLCVGCDLLMFERVFIARGVYDPTTYELLRALNAIPH